MNKTLRQNEMPVTVPVPAETWKRVCFFIQGLATVASFSPHSAQRWSRSIIRAIRAGFLVGDSVLGL